MELILKKSDQNNYVIIILDYILSFEIFSYIVISVLESLFGWSLKCLINLSQSRLVLSQSMLKRCYLKYSIIVTLLISWFPRNPSFLRY